MQIWITLTLAVQILSALSMIGLVLVQHGKGADMGASFGSGASGSLFGASGSANFLSRSTAALATVFFVCTLALAYMGSTGSGRGPAGGSSVLDRSLPAASEPAAGSIPGATPGVAAPAALSTTPASAAGTSVAPSAIPAPVSDAALPAAASVPASSSPGK
ncbi:MAG: preprotein translocase subunit SecG [Rubrivivax sp.]